jgi:2-keto-4-pentenoate hydratase
MRRLSDDGQRPIVGYKVSLTKSWGALFDGDALPSGASIAINTLFDPLIETEAIFHIDETIPAGCDIPGVLARCRVGSGIEVADSRWEGWRPSDQGFTFPPLEPLLPEARFRFPSSAMIEADNGFARYVVLGTDTVPGTSLDWPQVRVDARRDGEIIAGGSLSHVFEHPANSVILLADRLASIGQALTPGLWVSTGNPYTDLLTVPAGRFPTTFESVVHGVGTTAVTFV